MKSHFMNKEKPQMHNPKHVSPMEAYSWFFVLSLVMIVDVGLWFQRYMYQTAGHDSWISILLACPITLFVGWIIYLTMQQYPNADLYWINRHLFGKWAGMILNSLFAIYLLLLSTSMLCNIQEILVSLLFPDLPGWLFMSLICFLLVYGISGGVRVIVGFILVYFIGGQFIYILLIFPLKMSQWNQLLPIMEASPKQLLDGMFLMLKYNLGIIQLYFFYPFIRDKNRVKRYTLLSILYACFSAVFTLIVVIVYFGGEQLARTRWPNLTSFKIVTIPVLERFDILIVAYLLISVFSASLVLIWSSTRGFRNAWNLKQKHALYMSCILLIVCSEVINHPSEVEQFSKGIRSIGVWYEYVFPLILYICVRIKRLKGGSECERMAADGEG